VNKSIIKKLFTVDVMTVAMNLSVITDELAALQA
jgi:hypothetical protein